MLLYKIFGIEIDSTLLVFLFTIAGGFAWWLIAMFFSVRGLKKQIFVNRDTTADAAAQIKKDLSTEIETRRRESREEHLQTKTALEKQIQNVEDMHKTNFANIMSKLDNHLADDRVQFQTMNSALQTINKDVSESKGMLHVLVKDAKISFDKK